VCTIGTLETSGALCGAGRGMTTRTRVCIDDLGRGVSISVIMVSRLGSCFLLFMERSPSAVYRYVASVCHFLLYWMKRDLEKVF
jgi:hypothetical protein